MKMCKQFFGTHVVPIVLVGSFVSISSSTAAAQITMSGFKMEMKQNSDEETTQMLEDLVNRRVDMSPDHATITSANKTVTIEFHNSTKDTLVMDLFLSDTIVAPNRIVSKDAKSPTQTLGKKLLSDDPTDSISSIYRPMGSWVRNLPKSISLIPGERKSLTLTVDIADSPIRGEYATWVVAEVHPRKTLEKAKQFAYTISKVKLTYNTEHNINVKNTP